MFVCTDAARGVSRVAVRSQAQVVAGIPLGQDLGQHAGMAGHDVRELHAIGTDEGDPGDDEAKTDRRADGNRQGPAPVGPKQPEARRRRVLLLLVLLSW